MTNLRATSRSVAHRVTAVIAITLLLPCLASAQQERRTTPGDAPGGAPQTTFLAHHLGTDHAEGIASLDMDGDGLPDLVSGAYWYRNPGPAGGEWKRTQFREAGTLGEFVSDSGEWAIDVNHDGAPDIVTAGWMQNGLYWYENPRKPGVMWQRHFICDSVDTEGGTLADVNGDGVPDVVLAHYNHSGVLWVDFSGPKPRVHHVGDKTQDGHGIGVIDVDGDGRPDLLTPSGWFRNLDANSDKWEWHPDWTLGDAGFPILGYDVNADGLTDIIYGQGHSYGLYWLEQKQSGGKRTWVRHTIDESFSQAHALALADIDGDGQPELITGKRYRGHNGNDPGSYDPLVVYYYKINRTSATFTRFPIAVNSNAGIGTQIVALDLDGDGDMDLATAGKTGVTFFENLNTNKVPRESREKELLLDRNWPFPGEGPAVKQEDTPVPH